MGGDSRGPRLRGTQTYQLCEGPGQREWRRQCASMTTEGAITKYLATVTTSLYGRAPFGHLQKYSRFGRVEHTTTAYLHTLTMSTPNGPARPIIIVTGANKYVGACPPSTTPELISLPPRGQWRRLRDLSPSPPRLPARRPRRCQPAISTFWSRRTGHRVPLHHGLDPHHGLSQSAAGGGGAHEAA